MSESSPEFVEWREQHISQERGSRLVHYYLEDSLGQSHLAVVGTERSLRHMLYVASDEFCESYGLDMSGVSALKWRSRREVIDWLTSFIPGKKSSQTYFRSPLAHPLATGMAFNGLTDSESYQHKQMEVGRNLCGQSSDIVWSGISWMCGKRLRHYQAFCRDGITIGIHSFVLVMSEEENRLAYLEDMYEDKKGMKKVKVRWFHKNQEFACVIPPPNPHPSEVFITPYSQVISAECVDDIATLLIPDHFEKCFASLPHFSSNGIWLCFRQFSKKKFKLFDVRTLRGYYAQAVFSCLDMCSASGDDDELKYGGSKRIKLVKGVHKGFINGRFKVKNMGQNLKRDLSFKTHISVKFIGPRGLSMPHFVVNEKIELLCQDSGIRGCWFKCTVLQISDKRLKVQYDDVQDEEGCGNLEEWVPALRTAAYDKLGVRCSGRLNIRPCPLSNSLPENLVLEIGTSVDAWWSDGWWEGVVIRVDDCGDDSVHVYLPGEDIFLNCEREKLRISKDWVGNQWVDINATLNIILAISSVSPQAKLPSCSVLAKGVESGNSNDVDRQTEASLNRRNADDLLENPNRADLNNEDKELEAGDKELEAGDELNPRKRPRDDADEEKCDTKVEISVDGDNS